MNIIIIQQLIQHTGQKVQALGVDQTGDHRNHRNIWSHRKSQLLLQSKLVFRFFGQIRTVAGVNLRIAGRVVDLGVYAVNNPGQTVRPRGEQSIQSIAIIGCADFFRIGRADCSDVITVDNTRLHEIHVAIILYTQEIAVIQPQQLAQHGVREYPLIQQIMNGEHRTDLTVKRIVAVMRLQQQRNHCGMPVMAMQHIRLEIKSFQTLQHGTVEKRKPLSIVQIAVNAIPSKIIFVIDKVNGDAVIDNPFNAAILIAPADRHSQHSNMLHLRHEFLRDPPVFGQNHPDIHTCAFQRFG
ncbi:hypothetical protein D3C75_655360 [compost metagenome]